jgi:hypothetical protein
MMIGVNGGIANIDAISPDIHDTLKFSTVRMIRRIA